MSVKKCTVVNVRLAAHLRRDNIKVKPFVVSLSNHKQAFDKLRANGLAVLLVPLKKWVAVRVKCDLEFVNKLPPIYYLFLKPG